MHNGCALKATVTYRLRRIKCVPITALASANINAHAQISKPVHVNSNILFVPLATLCCEFSSSSCHGASANMTPWSGNILKTRKTKTFRLCPLHCGDFQAHSQADRLTTNSSVGRIPVSLQRACSDSLRRLLVPADPASLVSRRSAVRSTSPKLTNVEIVRSKNC